MNFNIKNLAIISLLCCLAFDVSATTGDPKLHSGFVYLNDIDPSIIVSLRYHQDENFLGKPIQGCSGQRAVVTAEAAEALRNVQEDLVMYGYSLVVYNAYHPQKTYKQLEAWLLDKNHNTTQTEYHPNLTKADLLKVGYIKDKFAHARGSTVDVTIISLKEKLRTPCKKQKKSYKNQKDLVYMNDRSMDMGTSYDLFDPLSAYANKSVPLQSQDNRKFLRESMQNHGFIPNNKVWWQFTLVREPYADSKFDFDV